MNTHSPHMISHEPRNKYTLRYYAILRIHKIQTPTEKQWLDSTGNNKIALGYQGTADSRKSGLLKNSQSPTVSAYLGHHQCSGLGSP
jgi:hypothetical protein